MGSASTARSSSGFPSRSRGIDGLGGRSPRLEAGGAGQRSDGPIPWGRCGGKTLGERRRAPSPGRGARSSVEQYLFLSLLYAFSISVVRGSMWLFYSSPSCVCVLCFLSFGSDSLSTGRETPDAANLLFTGRALLSLLHAATILCRPPLTRSGAGSSRPLLYGSLQYINVEVRHKRWAHLC